MADISAKQLLELIQKSQLLTTAELKAALTDLQKSNGGKIPADTQRIANELIKADKLTEWQFNKLLTGKYKGFFLGKYRLRSHLGSGGMSSVYLADHTMMNRRVAVKVLPRGKVNDRSYLERFYVEAQAVAALDHPNIVRAFDVDADGDTHYLVMEYVKGLDLHKLIKGAERPLHFGLAADYIRQAALGIQHAHDAKLIHRDIKPANLLLAEDGVVKLLDLGLARFAEQEDGSVTKAHKENVLGTADYLAPEQAINSHDVDGRVDIYSLGCTLYYLLAGHPPFNEGSLAQRIASHQNADPKPIREIRPDCPEPLAEICHTMMAKKPGDRIQTAGDVAKRLDKWKRESKFTAPMADEVPVIVTATDSGSPSGGSDVLGRVDAPSDVKLEVDDAEKQVATRLKPRKVKAKKPPIMLWVVLGGLGLVAIGLLAVVLMRGLPQ